MTTGESIDNVDMENVTVTSDAAFERVTSDEHFEDERDSGYLKQNTSGLVQEIPNISFIDIADTMLESKKTLYNRENWILRVGEAGRSIEAQPQDTVTLGLNEDYNIPSGDHYIEFDTITSSQHYTTCRPGQQGNIYTVEILQTGYYIISYGWEISTGNATDIKISVGLYTSSPIIVDLVYDRYKDSSLPEIMSGGKYVPNVLLNEGDLLCMRIDTDYAVTLHGGTYFNIQFQQYNI